MSLEDNELRDIARTAAREASDEFRVQTLASLDELVLKATSQILVGFGLQPDDQKEVRADLVYLRAWRKAMQQASVAGMIATFGVLIPGIAGAVWLGVEPSSSPANKTVRHAFRTTCSYFHHSTPSDIFIVRHCRMMSDVPQ